MITGVFIVGVALVWLFFSFKGRRLARVIDRCEVIVLKPLSITLGLLAVLHLFYAAWLLAGVFVVLWVLCGALGAPLHRDRTTSELAAGTIQRMERGRRRELGHGCAASTTFAGRIASPDLLLGENRCLTERATAPR